MIEKPQIVVKAKPRAFRFDGMLILFTLLALGLGVIIAFVVGRIGWIALAVIPVLVMTIGAVSRPNLGLYALIVLIFAQIQRVVTEFHDLPGPGQPLVALIMLTIAIRILIFNERPVNWIRNSFVFGVYLLFLMISVVTASNLDAAMSELFDVAQNVLIASMALYIVQDSSTLRGAIWAVIIAGILMASISVYQNLTGTFANNYWGFGGWEYSGYVGRPRMTGPYATPNPYAQVLDVIIVLAFDRLWHEKSLLTKLLAGVCTFLCTLALIYTDSRGGFANLAFTLFVYFLFNRPNVTSLIVMLFFGMVLVRFLPSNFTDRLMTLTSLANQSTPVADESFRGRMSENLAAWRMFLDHPVFGVGLDNYSDFYLQYSREIGLDPRREARDPASLYLQLLANQGLIGTLVFLLLIASVLIRLLRIHRDFKIASMLDEANLISALFAALAGYMFMSLYKNNAYTNVFWTLIALCVAAVQVAENQIGNSETLKETN